jgi:excisionase family DNA binding protein
MARYASFDHAAGYLGVDRRTIHALVNDGHLAAHWVGGEERVNLDQLDAAMTIAATRRYVRRQERVCAWADRPAGPLPVPERRGWLGALLLRWHRG